MITIGVIGKEKGKEFQMHSENKQNKTIFW